MLEFIKYLSQSRRMERIIAFYKDAPKKIKNNTLAFNQDIADLEAIILYYLYAFISYSNFFFTDDTAKRKAFLNDIWVAGLDFLSQFKNPQHPSTTLWVLEVFHAFSSKYLPQDVLEYRAVRSPLHINMNELLLQVGSILGKEYRLLYRPDKSIMAYTVIPLPPSVFDYFQLHKDSQELFDFRLNSESALGQRYKIYSLVFLDRNSVPLMKNCYAADKMDRMAMRVPS